MIRIFYIGLDSATLTLLSGPGDFSLVGTSKLDFLTKPSINIANLIFSFLYRSNLHKSRVQPLVQNFLYFLCIALKPLASATYRKYSNYILDIHRHKVSVVDFEQSDTAKIICGLHTDLLVTNAWGMLSEDILQSAKLGTINIHPSKLPKYRGSLPTLWALKNHDSDSAVTYLALSKKADAGEILEQHSFAINPNETYLDLENKISIIVSQTLVSVVRKFVSGEIKPIAQSESEATYTARYEEYRHINATSESKQDLFNKINLYPLLDPGTYCFISNSTKKIYIKKVFNTTISHSKQKAGRIHLLGINLHICTATGCLASRLFLDINLSDSVYLMLNSSSFANRPS